MVPMQVVSRLLALAIEVCGVGSCTVSASTGLYAETRPGWNVSNPSHRCFAAGTLVETRSGLRPIEELRPGELVLSRDDQTGATAWRSVVQRFETPDQEVVEIKFEAANGDNEALRVTPEHPFWTSEGWTDASELLPGTLVLTSSGGWIRVTSSTWAPEPTLVYNIEVEEFHTYFVGMLGAWVHNACAARGAGAVTRNVQGGVAAADDALRGAQKWLGEGYKEIAPGVFRSEDGLRQFRMTASDLTDPKLGPHVHFEAIAPDGRTIIENSHVLLPPTP